MAIGEKQTAITGYPNLRPAWKPGQSGNPAGRPPKNISITSLVKAKLLLPANNGKTYGELVADSLVELATTGKDMVAIKELLDRVEGKVQSQHLIRSIVLSLGDEYAMKALEASKGSHNALLNEFIEVESVSDEQETALEE